MSIYHKKIVYFDYMEDGIKLHNAGFAKIITDDRQCQLQLNIQGLPQTDTLNCKLLFLEEQKETVADNIFLKQGRGMYSRGFTRQEMRQLNLNYSRILGIKVRIAENRWVQGIWNLKPEISMAEIPQQQPAQEETPIKTLATSMEQMKGPVIADNKWKQLESIYSKVHPFGDNREYLSIEPKDFIVLTREYRQLVNNSFLLHGYYNYHHILLGRIRKSGEELYYLGVPGVFYEREKMVAVMFGFESFECVKEPAQAGEFGYYMKKVEI